ncbi:MAG: type II secretion system F family protein [Thermoguttaceae bacterium]
MTSPSSKPAITLDQLIALNDEIAALVRTGVPLDHGLQSLGADLPGRLGRFAAQLAEQIARGESLPDALAEPTSRLPRLYRAVVEAGIAAGRLPAALESLAGSLRRLAQTRRSVVVSLVYPLLLFLLAWGLFAFSASMLAPTVYGSFKELHIPGGQWFGPIARLGPSAWIWGPLGPMVLLVLAWLWWLGSKCAAVAQGVRSTWVFGWIPGLGRMLQLSRTAVFVEVLKLLVENRLPLDQAAPLAAEAAGDAALSESAEEFATAIRRGEPGLAADLSGLPPLLSWMIAGGQRNDNLLPALRHAADDYQRRAQYQAELLRVMVPVFVTCSISAVIVIAYAFVLLAPYYVVLRSLF